MERQKVVDRLVMLIAVVAIVFGAYFYYQWSLIKQNPQAVAQKEVAELVAKVSKLIDLPTDELPTVATVSDPEALKSQAFFAKAEKGDQILIYTKAKKAFLYSVTMNKILEVAPLNIGDGQKTTNTPKASSGSSN
jgi:hypothetical protein